MNYPLILNIGLAREAKSNISVGTVLREILASSNIRLLSHCVRHSDSEQTVVAVVEPVEDFGAFLVSVDFLSRLLGQDCIAVWSTKSGQGTLVGPNAHKWGQFNPAYFVLPNGDRLGQLLLQAAA